MPKDLPAKKVLDAVRNTAGNRVKVAVSDIDGVLRGKYIHKDKFFSAVEGGFGFCDVVFGWDMNDQCYDNTTLTGWHKGFPDALAKIDLGTHRTVPWDDGVPFFLGDFVRQPGRQGKFAHPLCPRQLLKRVLRRAEKLGVSVHVRHGIRMVQLRRDAAIVGRQGLRAAGADHAGHVRLLAAARGWQARILQGADGRDGRLRRADRRPAHRDRPGRVRGRDPVLRGARGGRPGDPVQDRRQGNRRALRHHAELHGEMEPALSRLLGPHPPEPFATARSNLFHDAQTPHTA